MEDVFIVAFENFKGGVTKTTSSLNIAACLGLMDYSVLFIDADSQCNSTSSLMRGKTKQDIKGITPSTYNIFIDKNFPISKAIRKRTREHNVHLVPSSREMDTIDVELSKQMMWGLNLEKRRNEIKDLGYDFVIIDTPPGSKYIRTMAMYASDMVILPTVPSNYSVDALVDMVEEISEVKHNTKKEVDIRFLLSRMQKNGVASRETSSELRTAFGNRVFKTEIPNSEDVTRAEKHAKSLLRSAGSSQVAIAYANLAKEIVSHVQ